MDDSAYHSYAAQIARSPLDPYGFVIHWYDHPQPAHDVLAPPVLPYWWALGIRLFGDDPLRAKLWLLPWCLLLAASVHSLARRFAGPAATPVTWMILFAPTIVVSFNLMLDVPALALALAAVAVFLGTAEWQPTLGAIVSGLLAGLAMQTKYTALVVPLVIIAAALILENRRELRRGLFSAGLAVTLFASWELFVAAKYGSSHFLYHVAHDPGGRFHRTDLFWPMIGLLGSVASPLIVLALARRSLFRMSIALGIIVMGFLFVALIPRSTESTHWTPTAIVFGVLGMSVMVSLISAIVRFRASDPRNREMAFLIGWFLIELAGYFVLTPWPAVRRVIGIVVVATLMIGRNVASAGTGRLWFAASCMTALGAMMQAIDIENGRIERDAVAAIDADIRARSTGGAVWFTGRRGWFYCAESAGWKSIDPGATVAQPGDWLVIPDADFGGPRVEVPESADRVESREWMSRSLLGTIPYFYGTNAAVWRRDKPYMTVQVFLINRTERLNPADNRR
jgi:4-amino-4-deoxy-L-arabinose transferase-like glycosyltransferase